MAAASPTIRRYHHGNLAEELIAAATAMAARGGPDAVVLREVARTVGVSPTAAYRHFAGQADLQDAVKDVALQRLADHMRAAAAGWSDDEAPATTGDSHATPQHARPQHARAQHAAPQHAAIRRLVAIGRGYFDFALTEPGLFRCFCIGLPMTDKAGLGDEPAFGVLTEALDALVDCGLLSTERRAEGADIAAWASVHGLAVLCLDGPLADLPRADQDRLFHQTIDVLLHGLLG